MQITYQITFLYLVEENENAGINDPKIQKHLKKLLLIRILTQKVGKQTGVQLFGDFKMYLFRLKYPGFFNKKNPHSPEKLRLTDLTNNLINS